jgi:hypothetical protein
LPTWSKDATTTVATLAHRPPPDAAQRGERFAQRNSPEEIAALCLKLEAALEPTASGLDAFRPLTKQTRYAAALDAYRAYFFAKLKNPQPAPDDPVSAVGSERRQQYLSPHQ